MNAAFAAACSALVAARPRGGRVAAMTAGASAFVAITAAVYGGAGAAAWPALLALFLYGLLPIVRNTAAGIAEVGHGMRSAGRALGLRAREILWIIELPLASRTLIAGIRTAAVINVGTATLAAFIGAGGYGERIVAGLAVNDTAMLLAGAVPAAVLAVAIDAAFGYAQRWLVPRGLRILR